MTSAWAAPLHIPPDPLLLLGTAQENGTTLLSVRGKYSSHIRFVDVQTGELKHQVWLPPETVLTIRPALSGDGKKMALLLSPDTKGNARVVVLDSHHPVLDEAVILVGGLDKTAFLSLNHDGTRLAAGNKNGYVQLWDTEKGQRLVTIPTDTGREPLSVQWGGEMMATFFRGQTKTRLFSTKTGQSLMTLSGVGTGLLSADGLSFWATRGRWFSVKDGKEQATQAVLKGTSGVLGQSNDGKLILVRRSGLDAQGREWLDLREVATGHVLGSVTRIPDGNPELLTPDGSALVGGDGLGGIRVLPFAQ